MPVENPFALPSFAKINLSLRILGRRADGFHELCTIFQTVSLADRLTFRANDGIVLTCINENIPIDESNLIVRAALKLREKYGIASGAAIHLEKNTPAPGGLGGGSSNAAVALLGLAKLWKIEFDFQTFEEIGKTLGADVPFFLCGGTALGVGRGDEIVSLADAAEKNLLIVTPNIAVSTAAAFARVNAARLTNKTPKSILQICREQSKIVDFQPANLINDFEETVFRAEPEIGRVKETLLSFAGARAASLSGSGASVFAVFESDELRQKALYSLKSETNWRVFAVETVSRSDYRASLRLTSEAD